jgi:hypothetical protein
VDDRNDTLHCDPVVLRTKADAQHAFGISMLSSGGFSAESRGNEEGSHPTDIVPCMSS